jgi:HD superfamily phosphohydrolase
MKAQEAIEKIAEMLGLQFGKVETFATTTLKEGDVEVTNNLDEEFKIGQTLYVVNESTLSPAPEGQHTTREGLVITVDSSSVIIAMEQESEEAPANEEDESEVSVEQASEEMAEVEVEKEIPSELVDALIKALNPMVQEMKTMVEDMKKMKEKMSSEVNGLKEDFETFKKSPERKSVVEKTPIKESFADYRLEVIKKMLHDNK